MGNGARMRNREVKKNRANDEMVTMTRKAISQIAQQEAQRILNEHGEKIKERTTNDIKQGIAATAGYMLASVLEEMHGFGKVRAGKCVAKFMETLVDIGDNRVKIEDHMRYWNEKGLTISEDEKGFLTVKA